MATEHNTHEEYLQSRGVLVLAISCSFVAVKSAVAYLVILSGVFLLEIIEFWFKLLMLLASTIFSMCCDSVICRRNKEVFSTKLNFKPTA